MTSFRRPMRVHHGVVRTVRHLRQRFWHWCADRGRRAFDWGRPRQANNIELSSNIAMLAALALCSGVAAAQASDDPLKIGVITDMSGVYSDIVGAGTVTAVEMAVQDFGGTVLGRPIKVIFADHQNKADVGAAIVRKWLDDEGVDVVVNGTNSAVALAVQQLTRDRGKIFLITGAGTSSLHGKNCSPTGFHWTYDTDALARVIGTTLVEQGAKTWFFVAADYAFGAALTEQTTRAVEKAGGRVLGGVRHPLNTSDLSSFLLQAQASKADVIALANAGGDAVNAIRQAQEFGITPNQRLAALLLFINDIRALGLKSAAGLMLTEAFYWDQNDGTRAFSRRFFEKHGKMPSSVQAGDYSAVMHYLKAVKAANTRDGRIVAAKMREIPVNDFMSENVKIREDGRVMRNMYLYKVKSETASKYPWDYYEQVATVPAEVAALPLSEGKCPYVAR